MKILATIKELSEKFKVPIKLVAKPDGIDENKNYDRIMVWRCDSDGDIRDGHRYNEIPDPDRKMLSPVPEMMDICPVCFEKFYDWIRTVRKESK